MTTEEIRFVEYLDTRVSDGTFSAYSIISFSDSGYRMVFKALQNDLKVFYTLDENSVEETDPYNGEQIINYTYTLTELVNVGSYIDMEQRFNAYLVEKVNDGTFDMAWVINIWENLNKCEFKGSVNGTVKFYYLTEEATDSYDEAQNGIITTFKYTYLQLTNVGDNGTQADDSRIYKILMDVAQDLPKDTSNPKPEAFKNVRVQNKLALWKECIKNDLFAVDPAIRAGIDLIDIEDRDLTSEQLPQKYAMLNWIYKLNARFIIESEVGDIYDLLADVSKRLALTERLTMRVAGQLLGVYPWDDDTKTRYEQYIQWYLNMIYTGEYVDRADLENEADLIATLLDRSARISGIVKAEYFDNKK